MPKLIIFSEESIKKMIDMYNETGNVALIARKFDTFHGKVKKILEKRGIVWRADPDRTNRKYTIDHECFSVLTPEVAYWMGFIAADGYVNQKINVVTITLHGKDWELLEKWAKFLKTNKPVRRYQQMVNGKIADRCQLSINSKKIVYDLVSVGIIQNKSLVLKPPVIPKEFYSHFIRGLFDGDGCICFSKNTSGGAFKCFITITSTFEMCSWLREIASEIGVKTLIYRRTNKNTFRIDFPAHCNTLEFCNFIYFNSTIHLKRKHERYLILKEYTPKRPINRFCVYEKNNKTGNTWYYDGCSNGVRFAKWGFKTKQEAFNECYKKFIETKHPCLNKLIQCNKDCVIPNLNATV